MKPDVMVLAPILPRQMAELEALYTLHRWDLSADQPACLAEFGPRCTAVVTSGHTPLTGPMIAAMPRLRLVACSSAGYEYIDHAALTAAGAVLTNTSEALADDVADCAILLMLAARRGLIAAHDYVRSGDWGRKGMFPLQRATRGARMGIVGMGRIGRAIALRAQAMAMEVAYHSRTAKPDTGLHFEPDLPALAAWADVLCVIVAGGAGTRNLIGAEVLSALGPEGTLVNVSRGSVVDETALIAALREGRLGAAALDVFWNEPFPDPALTALPNVTLYPHHASGTAETRDAMAQLVVDNLAAHFAGRPLLTPV